MVDSTGGRSDPLRVTPEGDARPSEITDPASMKPADVPLLTMIIVKGVVLVSFLSAALLVVLM